MYESFLRLGSYEHVVLQKHFVYVKPLIATVAINSLVNECAFGAMAQKKATAANIKHKLSDS